MVLKHVVGFRLLLLSDSATGGPVRSLLAGGPLATWDVVEARSFEHARFLQQWNPCDVLLVDRGSVPGPEGEELTSLPLPGQIPLVVLSDAEPVKTFGLMGHWLPRRLALENPQLLAVILQQAAQYSRLEQLLQQQGEVLHDSQRQVNRLVDLLWQSVSAQAPTPWFTQRQMVERLHEEVLRSQRYGDALSVVVGELDDGPGQPLNALEPGELIAWTARQLGRHKRRSDVAGQYGPQGFLLLLTQTNELGAGHCCRRLHPLLESTDDLPEGARSAPRIRFGLSSFTCTSTTVPSLLARAEESLEQARKTSSWLAP